MAMTRNIFCRHCATKIVIPHFHFGLRFICPACGWEETIDAHHHLNGQTRQYLHRFHSTTCMRSEDYWQRQKRRLPKLKSDETTSDIDVT